MSFNPSFVITFFAKTANVITELTCWNRLAVHSVNTINTKGVKYSSEGIVWGLQNPPTVVST